MSRRMIPKETFRLALIRALQELGRETRSEFVTAALLGGRVIQRLYNTLSPDQLEEALASSPDGRLRLNGLLFGGELCPQVAPEHRYTLKFRNFLRAFPDLVEVMPGRSGDMVRVVANSLDDPERALAQEWEPSNGHLVQDHRSTLLSMLPKVLTQEKVDTVSVNRIREELKKSYPSFTASDIGFSSLNEWLKTIPEIELSGAGSGARITLKTSATVAHAAPSLAQVSEAKIAYLAIDSADTHAVLHEMLGTKLTRQELPEWSQVLEFLRSRFPDFEWRTRFFASMTATEHKKNESFFSYLKHVGITPFWLELDEGKPSSFLDQRHARCLATQTATAKLLEAIKKQGGVRLVAIATHNPAILPALQELLTETDLDIYVLGFIDKMPPALRSLVSPRVSFFDLEHDCAALKKSLGRARGYNYREISGEAFL